MLRAQLGVAIEGVELPAAVARRFGVGPRALAVRGVHRDGPAHAAGVKAGDLLLALDGRAIASVADLYRTLGRDAVGRTLGLDVLRGGERVALRVTPAQLDEAA